MTTMPEQIGAYTIDRELGRGGMGVVYLGRDTRLDRAVAIKAIPAELAEHPDRLVRFEREARTLATLHHVNVGGIYGVEDVDGRKFLILEYVEGETLADLLDRGPMAVDDALEIAIQVASGVEAAHEAGIIHRDLKPANIKITPDGQAKVLDFGLARSEETSSSGSSVSQAPTMSSPNSPTIAGAILGTAPYMSPEQARGRSVDRRTDIWSFGVVLYECLTGSSPFVGETATDSIGAILHKDVDLDRLPPETPVQARSLIERCLQREKRQRLQAIGDARIELERALAAPDRGLSAERSSRSGAGRWMAIAVLLLIAVAAGYAAHHFMAPAPKAERALHVAVPIGPNPYSAEESTFAISPVARTIAYIAQDPEDDTPNPPTAIYVHDLHAGQARRLAGTDHARRVSFSPDGSQLAFVWFDPESDREEIRRIPVDGGPVLTVYLDRNGDQYSMGGPPFWISDDELLAYSQDRFTLYRVSTSGGALREIITLSREGGWITTGRPTRLDEESIIICRGLLMTDSFSWTQFRLNLTTGDLTKVIDDAGRPHVLASGHLLFIRDRTLCSAPFDIESAQVTGPVTPLIAGLAHDDAYSISHRGDLLYALGPDLLDRALITFINRDGEKSEAIQARRNFGGSISVSPNGRQILTAILPDNGPPTIHTIDIDTGFIRPIVPSIDVTLPSEWTPDGQVMFSRWYSTMHAEIMLADIATASSASVVMPEVDERGFQSTGTITPDGRHIVFGYRPLNDEEDEGIYMIDLDTPEESREAIPVVVTSAEEDGPALSPDGAWLAYVTNASGKRQVALRAFDSERPDAPARVYPVSFDGGWSPFWSRDGKELFFIDMDDDHLMSVTIETEPSLSISTPVKVLDGSQINRLDTFGYHMMDVMPDGNRFVYIENPDESETLPHLHLTLDWFAEHPEFK